MHAYPAPRSLRLSGLLLALLLFGTPRLWSGDLEEEFRRNARRAAPRDAFPVFDHPEMATAAEGDRKLRPTDWVIGVTLGGEAKAYPIAVMGLHELGNDTCGGIPIAVGW